MKKIQIIAAAVVVFVGLLMPFGRTIIKYHFSWSVKKQMSKLYPADKFRITERKTHANTFRDVSYEVTLRSELLNKSISVEGTGGKWEESSHSGYQILFNRQLVSWLYEEIRSHFREENMPYLYVKVEGGKYPFIYIWMIVDHNKPTDELYRQYDDIVFEAANKIIEEKGADGLWYWILVDKDRFFNDYYLQADLAGTPIFTNDKYDNELIEQSTEWFFYDDISVKLRQGSVLTKEEMDLLYNRLFPFYDRLSELNTHILYYGDEYAERRGWAADFYSDYPDWLQTTVQQEFGDNAYGSFMNKEPEGDQEICVYVFGRPVNGLQQIRNFIAILTGQTDWSGTVDVLYLNESHFWKNPQMIRSVYTGKHKYRGTYTDYILDKAWLGDNTRDFLYPEEGISATTPHERKQFYENMRLYKELDIDDTDDKLKVIYSHYQSPITPDPDIQLVEPITE